MQYFPQQVLLCTSTVNHLNQQTPIFIDIKGAFGYEILNLQKYTKFINLMFHVIYWIVKPNP